jgi:hypothetical protein
MNFWRTAQWKCAFQAPPQKTLLFYLSIVGDRLRDTAISFNCPRILTDHHHQRVKDGVLPYNVRFMYLVVWLFMFTTSLYLNMCIRFNSYFYNDQFLA